MYNLTDVKEIKSILSRHGFNFSKSFGQNFLINPQIPQDIAIYSGINNDSGVIEIGPGMGTLTYELCKRAKKVVSVEIDKKLIPVLEDTMADFSNFTLINKDILKTDLKKLIEEEFCDMDVYICANLPYYITTPIIMKLLEEDLPIKSITVMVQKEVASRLCATEKDKDNGAISLAIRYYTTPKLLFDVAPDNFLPAPKVTSSVISLIPNETKISCKDKDFMFRVIKAAFSQRRKTLLNSLSGASYLDISKEDIKKAMEICGFSESVRGEKLSLSDFAKFSDVLLTEI
ncbi:MAG: 16S rRNA (adenine(1518)-N(6)/adenine(1519)-N(6))-dimethyltransferase RsmA [Clostridia bacterium]|nr:16S rRNA (adenine(1518)-N(6)/adenine(1519)-N(6))-dimethyltransferase RsmA [Clostridia bacterium]